MEATVIISVYKNFKVLERVLQSLEQQTCQEFEVIISEDGESPEMAHFVRNYEWRWPMQHLTQEDLGWRKELALNRAIQAAKNDWLIFIDGDCVLHSRFIEMHVRYKQSGVMLAGKRIKLSPTLSDRMMLGEKICFFPYLFLHRGCRYVEEAFFTPLATLFRRKVRHLVGSNMSMSRQDLLKVNGFDENYVLPACGEDYDIEWRMMKAGCRIVSLRNLAVQYHIWHTENWVQQEENLAYCRETQSRNEYICKNGIVKR